MKSKLLKIEAKTQNNPKGQTVGDRIDSRNRTQLHQDGFKETDNRNSSIKRNAFSILNWPDSQSGKAKS